MKIKNSNTDIVGGHMNKIGRVLWFGGYNKNTHKINDYGFIETNVGSTYFLHQSEVVSEGVLQEGDLVEFIPRNRKNNDNDKQEAQEVKIFLTAKELRSGDRDRLTSFVSEWIDQQSPEFLLQNLNELPYWTLTLEPLLKKVSSWLSGLPFSEQHKYKNAIPDTIKEQLNLWFLFTGDKFNSSFAAYWNNLSDDIELREECLEHWLHCFHQNTFERNCEVPLTNGIEGWIKKRYELSLTFPTNWIISEYYMMTGQKLQSLDSEVVDSPLKINLSISNAWKNLPPDFFKMLTTKVKNKESDLEIPFEAWALYLRHVKPTEYLVYWIKNLWKAETAEKRLTFFGLLGGNWLRCFKLHIDLGSNEVLLLWEDLMDLSVKGLWWEQLDTKGKCSWYILAFQKGYKNKDFLDSSPNDLLLHSFQLLYKHYLETENLNSSNWHSLLVDYYINLTKNGNEKALKDSKWLWPACEYNKCTYCEGKPWRMGNKDFSQIGSAYCPRTKKECVLASTERQKGARFRNYNNLPAHWIHWRMPEILNFLQIEPPYENTSSSAYVTRFGGWLNRLLELQERLKCRACHETMENDFKYSKDFTAKFSMTIATCKQLTPGDHDKEIYFNDCWNHRDCNKMIDSRDNLQKDKKDRSINPSLGKYRNYYLCIDCGAAKGPKHYPGYIHGKNKEKRWDYDNLHIHFKDWYYVPGDVCPKCGVEEMKRFSKNSSAQNTHAKCNNCLHTIQIPQVFLTVTELWDQHRKK